jgi:hypothetical protein
MEYRIRLQMVRIAALPIVVAMAVSMMASSATAGLVVPSAQSTFFSCNGDEQDPNQPVINASVAGLGTANGNCTLLAAGASGTTQMKTFLTGDGPLAQTTVTANAGPPPKGNYDINAHTTLTYYVGVEQTAPTPFPVSIVPVDFSAGVFALGTHAVANLRSVVSGFENVSGGVSLEFNPGELFPTLDESLATLPTAVQFEVDEGPAIAQVFLDALCGVELQPSESANVTCTADPLVGFDQAAFDAQFGPNSLQLADYFGFVFSDGLAPLPPSSAPEPATLALLAGGLAAMCFRHSLVNRRHG